LKTCTSCGAELANEAKFCQLCGATQANGPTTRASNQLMIPKAIFYALMIGLALMGLAVVGLVVRGPSVITETQNNYITQTQFATYTANYLTTSTETQAYTVTAASYTTQAAGPPPTWFVGQYCGYPFNPYTCNEGPPVTVAGYLTNDTTCVDLYVATGETYVVWNLPKTEPAGAYQIYGFVYPNWPQTQPFPPYPFQKTLCVGTPLWAVPPYIQTD